MLIQGDRLILDYWDDKHYCCRTIPEIHKEEYGYKLEPGQRIQAVRYSNTNQILYFKVEILKVSEKGIVITDYNDKRIICPWTQKIGGVENILQVEPCDCLYEKIKMQKLLKNVKPDDCIWYHHGGWRGRSAYSENLNNFVKTGQQMIV